ncbi:UDP-glucose/GDP-mannose dehydrogenase family protein [Isoptericola sp. b441]|uniref:UDP-glucose 6-dehydrogenase n=1 Tax=Actinotalea lenta TaxID=3064654 RepID=A0ABT9D8J1_9CELL|nr:MULTISPECIES: UDP-glucose/GDP-mannose dehydrogenase family protein [unclassified Isoptericola]MDO8107205.1 UDP-glucose/GDP-mannose dehydrogenase family protein [Isoptericola sp. b441]MDO8121117.1 UDP-glucose/GDP-mannose dehydrogenase family protein [Isoptericola sp. b490]
MNISVIGCGYLGAVHAACMAHLGHDVVGIDTDRRKVDALSDGQAPFFEPGFPELLREAVESGRLRFTDDFSEAADSDAHFLCVGTPQRDEDGAADLRHVDAAFEALLPHLDEHDLVIGKSTVPVGTAERMAGRLETSGTGARLAWNPEFLREGFAVDDTLRPDRLVYGVPDGEPGRQATATLDSVYATALEAGTPQIVTDYGTAQLVKVAANSFLATKISFINAMSEVCEATGSDVTALAEALGHDDRIGNKFLRAGLGFGGGCLPKDIRAFQVRAGEVGADQALSFLSDVDAINTRSRERTVEHARQLCGGSFDGARIAVLGAAFKPNSDDVRDSPALDVALRLQRAGAAVVVTDPQANANAVKAWPELDVVDEVESAATGADLVVLVTEWQQFRDLDPAKLGTAVRERRILDARNVLDPAAWREAGWTYRGLGRR